MSTFNDAGLILDRYTDVLSRLHVKYKEEYGDSINLASDSFDGHLAELISLVQAEMNDIVQELHDQGEVKNATKSALEAAVSFIGMQRQQASPSTIEEIQITSAKATTVLKGSLFETVAGVKFATDVDLVFTAAGNETVTGTCTENGPFDVEIGGLDTLTNSISGITAVTNLTAAIPGSYQQTDGELKYAHELATATTGEGDVASIYEGLSETTGVTGLYVEENDTSEYIGLIPGKSLYVVVIGGSDTDVATTIYAKKTGSVTTYGTDENVSIYDDTLCQSRVINFDRGADTSVYIEMTLQKVVGQYPDNGDDTIKEGLAELYSTKRLNNDVIYNEHWGAIYAVPGIVVNSLYVGLAASPSGTSNISMSKKQRPSLDVERDDDNNISSINVVINEA